ncbi:MAG: HAD family hydrolase [Acidimicrobiia bacterium]
MVFDIDDTLFLERDYVHSGFHAVGSWAREHVGVDDFGERCWDRFEQGARGHIFDQVLDELGLQSDPTLVARLVETYRCHEPTLSLAPDAVVALSELSNQVALAAVTDGPLESQRAKARALGLPGRLDPIVYTAEVGFPKPDPRAFTLVERAHSVRGRECMYVADNPMKDFAGPLRLGWQTARVRRGGSLHAALESDADIDLEIESLSILAELVTGARHVS